MNNRNIWFFLRQQRVVWFAFALVGVFFLFFQNELIMGFEMPYLATVIIKMSSIIFILIAISLLLLDYLKGNKYVKQELESDMTRKNMYLIEELRSQVKELHYVIRETKKSENNEDRITALTENDKEKLFDIITKTVSSNINSEFLKSLDEKYSLKIIGDRKYKELLQSFDQTRARVVEEIGNLSRRANLNLVIGSITTIIAVSILFISVYTMDIELSDATKTLSYFIPRISTVIFIEVFSFFFLKLYRGNLNDVKYYQNEMTNIEFKILSLKSALMIDDKETLTQIIIELNKTERNFILQQGETTVEIETAKNQNKFDKSFIDNLKVLLDSSAKLRNKE